MKRHREGGSLLWAVALLSLALLSPCECKPLPPLHQSTQSVLVPVLLSRNRRILSAAADQQQPSPWDALWRMSPAEAQHLWRPPPNAPPFPTSTVSVAPAISLVPFPPNAQAAATANRQGREEEREQEHQDEHEERRKERDDEDADSSVLYCIEGMPHYSRRFLPHKIRYQCQFSDGICCPNGETCCPRDSACRPDGKCIRPRLAAAFGLKSETASSLPANNPPSQESAAKSADGPTPAVVTQPIGKTVEHSMTVIDNNNHVSVREAVAPH